MVSKTPPPSPPRFTGDQDTDNNSLKRWLGAFHENTVLGTRLLDPNKQFVPDAFDPTNLPDPTDSSIANAQQTANQAYTNGAAQAANALSVAQSGIDGLDTRVTTLETTVTAHGTRLTTDETNITAVTTTANSALSKANQALAQGPVLHGQLTVVNLSTTGVLTFAAQVGTLRAVIIPHSKFGTPPDGAFIIESVTYTSTSVTVTVRAAPGSSNVVTFDVILFILF